MLGNAGGGGGAGVSAVGVSAFRRFGGRCLALQQPPPASRQTGGVRRPAAGATRPGTVLGLMGFMWGTEDHGSATRMNASGSNDAVSPICHFERYRRIPTMDVSS